MVIKARTNRTNGTTNHAGYERMVRESNSEFWVHTDIYTDPEIFEDEMRYIFEETWIYVAHASELPNPGDYKTSHLGKNPIIVSRAEDGSVHVLLNECRHRGNAVSRLQHGNTSSFRCPYHGWVYACDGSLISPSYPKGYPRKFQKKDMGLIRIKTEVYRGLIFASMNPHVESLEEWLGGVKHYLDLWADMSPIGDHKIHRPHSSYYQANWKFQCDNGHDGWHGRFVHESAFTTFSKFAGSIPQRAGAHLVASGNTRGFDKGHGMLDRPGPRSGLSDDELNTWKQMLMVNHGSERTDEITSYRGILLFPSVCLFDDLIRVIQPVSVTETIVHSHALILNGAPDSINDKRLLDTQKRLSSSGMIATDDLEMFVSNQTGMKGRAMEWILLSHGIHQEGIGPVGEIEGSDVDEVPQRAQYRRWAELMSGH